MVVDATREFRIAFDELDRSRVPDRAAPEGRATGTARTSCPSCAALLGKEPALADYLPVGAAPYYLQYHYIVANPHPAERRKLLDDAGDGSDYSRLHAIYHPLMRAAAATVGFFDFMMADPKSGRLIYTVEKEVDFATSLQFGPYRHSNRRRRRRPLRRHAPTGRPICLEDFAPYAPSGGAPIAFMAAPVIDQGVVIGVLVAQLSNEEIDNVVTGDRRWRQEGFGDTGEAYLVGPDYLRALRPAGVLRESRALLRRAEGRRRLGRGDRRHPALRDAGAASAHRHPGDAGPRSPASRARARSSATAASRRSLRGGRSRFPASSGRSSPRSTPPRPSRRSTSCAATC